MIATIYGIIFSGFLVYGVYEFYSEGRGVRLPTLPRAGASVVVAAVWAAMWPYHSIIFVGLALSPYVIFVEDVAELFNL